MAFASGSQHGLRFVPESSWGATPSTPQTIYLRHTSCAIALSKDGFQSQELRSDRQISDFRHGVKRVQGDIGFELSYGEYDAFLEAALFGEFDYQEDISADNVLKAGTVRKSFTIERAFLDITQFGVFTGCMVNSFSLSIPANNIVTGSFGIVGKDGSYSGSALTAEPTAAQTEAPFDSFTGAIKEGSSSIAIVTSLDINLENGLDPNLVIGSNTAAAITDGRSNVTGSVSAYFENLTLLNKFINETESSIEITLGGETKKYDINIPRIKYTGGDNPVSGEGPIMLNLPFQALLCDTLKTNLQITRTPAQ